MIKNYFKSAWRNLWKSKGYSIINIVGLAVGLAAVLIIALWIQNQFRYDNFYNHQAEIYKLKLKTTSDNDVNVGDITSAPVAALLQKEYPEVTAAARMYWLSNSLLSYKEKSIKSAGNEVDPSFLDIFNFKVLKGTRTKALHGANTIVITESLAKNLFGNDDPMNKVITLDTDQSYTVTAVLEDLPSYTDFEFSYLIPLSSTAQYGMDWKTNTYFTFVRLRTGTDVEVFNKKIGSIVRTHAPDLKSHVVFLYPMSKQYLYSRFENGIAVGGKIEEVRLVGFIGMLILLIAGINFVNLSTARGQKRAREVGVRKVVGAGRAGLIKQFLLESILLAAVAGLIALFLVLLTIPLFSQIMEIPLSFEVTNVAIWMIFVSFILLTGILAGLYPAFFLSNFAPVKTLKGVMAKEKGRLTFREVLVVLQFGVAIFLIIATITVRTQIHHAQERNIGYANSQLLEIPLEGNASGHYEAIKAELMQRGAATSVTRTGWSVTLDAANAGGTFSWEGATPEQTFNTNFRLFRAESDFVNTLGLTLIDGRDLDYTRLPADSVSVLLNEAAIKTMGLDHPVGKYLKWGERTYTIVGVFNDFIIGSPYSDVRPMIVYASKNYMSNMIVRTEDGHAVQKSLSILENVMKKFNPAYPFSYEFADQRFAQKFKDQQQTATLTLIFSILAICISCLGLFGLIAYVAETRTKEIGIRKVLGASVSGIVAMLSKDFIKLVCLAIVIATPIAWWAMNNWLQDFAYRIDIQWWMFGLAGLMAVLIALATVSWQAVRAAVANPVESLRDE